MSRKTQTRVCVQNLVAYNAAQWMRHKLRLLAGDTRYSPNFIAACHLCFSDNGLALLAQKVAIKCAGICPNCRAESFLKLRMSELRYVLHTFFVWGSYHVPEFGGFPAVQFNDRQRTSVEFPPWLEPDARLFERLFGIGFFFYGPRAWMYGEITPLKLLQDEQTRSAAIERIVSEYPHFELPADTVIYRLRIDPGCPGAWEEYDSPPNGLRGCGRFDSTDLGIMYASADLELCIHECRVAANDRVYVASMKPTRPLRLLDLTKVLVEESVSEFDSLDLAVHLLFMAGSHSYPITKYLALRACQRGFDGIVYPSFFSSLRTSAMPLMTTYGMSHRLIPRFREVEEAKIVPSLGLFGQPLADRKLAIKAINRLILNEVVYGYHFGPAEIQRRQKTEM